MTIIATTTVRLVHRVGLRHAATGEQIAPVTAHLDPVPYGWSLRVHGGDVVVSARDGVAAPTTTPILTVSVADPRAAAVLATPSIDVALVAADITLDVAPVPMTLTVELATAGTGAARTGRTITARAASGPNPKPTVPLPEVSAGVYRSAPFLWTAVFTPLDLLVDGDLLRQLAIDFTRTETHVRLVDTT